MAKWLRRQTHMFKVPGSIPTMGKISLPKTPTRKKRLPENVYRVENENIGVHRRKNKKDFLTKNTDQKKRYQKPIPLTK